jgi:hypothetical protein
LDESMIIRPWILGHAKEIISKIISCTYLVPRECRGLF